MYHPAVFGLCLAVLSGSPALANCWNAEDEGQTGDPVEICRNDTCEVTAKVFECVSLSSLIIGYANGLSVSQDLTVTPPVTNVLDNGRRLSPSEVGAITCKDIEGRAACAFDIAQRLPTADIEAQLSQIEAHFKAQLGVDAEHMQMKLMEAGLLSGRIDGVWGPATEDAFRQAIRVADSYGVEFDYTRESAMYELVNSVRGWNFDPDSGLIAQPFAGAYILVVASREQPADAEANYEMLDARLLTVGLSGRAGILTAANGVFAVTAGMYTQVGCEEMAMRLKSDGLIPKDAYCASIDRFDPMNWAN